MHLKSSKEFLQNAFTNGTFSIDALDKALRMTLDHSFSYLYRLQRNLVTYEEFFYTTTNVENQPDYGDMYLDRKERVCINIPAELILPNGRERFRTSSYWGTEISITDLASDHKIFAKFPIIIIDNQVVRNFSLKIYNDYFTVILPFKKRFIYNTKFIKGKWNYEHIEHTTSVQIINNTFFGEIKTNKAMLKTNSYDGSSYDRIYDSYLQDLNLSFNLTYKGSMFAIVYTNGDDLGSLPQDVDRDEDGNFVIHYDEKTKEKLNSSSGEVTIQFLFYRYLYKHKGYRYTEDDFSTSFIPTRENSNEELMSELMLFFDKNDKLYGMPIPTENIIAYKKNSSGDLSHFSNSNVEIGYPNIYKIRENIEEGDSFLIYYFYIPPYDLTYEYQFQFFYSFLKYKWEENSLEKTVNGLYFGDIDISENSMINFIPDEEEIPQPIDIDPDHWVNPEGCMLGLFYEWAVSPENRKYSREEMEYIYGTGFAFGYDVTGKKTFYVERIGETIIYPERW